MKSVLKVFYGIPKLEEPQMHDQRYYLQIIDNKFFMIFF